MQTIIDLDLRQVVSDFTVKSPAPPYSGKSQDTQSHEIYFVQAGAIQDLGTGPAIKFGLIGPGGPSLLVLQTTYTRQVDVNGNVFYLGYPIFNTSNLATALGTNLSIACTAEIRYQLTTGEIEHSLDIPITIYRTILTEITSSVTTAAFSAPAVGANVTIAITSTSWLAVGQQLTIATAGIYQVVSITDSTHFVGQNTGQPGNASSGTNIPSGSAVAGAPVNALTTYPPSNTLELISTRDIASGHAGLDATTHLNPAVIPVDTVTIQILDGQLASAAILAETAATFLTPAANANVTVTLVSSVGLVPGQYVRLPVAGYYIVESIPDGTHAVLQNNGDPYNAISGVTIAIDTPLLPAQAAAGGAGGGTPGQNAYSVTTAGFTVPAVGATVSVPMQSTAWLGGSGYYVFITGAGYYAVNAITDTTHAVLTNAGSSSNVPPGSSVPSGVVIAAAGAPGAAGASGAGLAAYDSLTAQFTMPAVSANVTIAIGNTAWVSVGQIIYIATAGYFQVAVISSATQASITNLNYPGNATAATVIAAGSKVSPGGLIGPQGAGGAGLNAFTTLSANFVQPAISGTVTINVGTTAWMAPNLGIFIQGGGYYTISSIADLTHAVVINLGGSTNLAAGSTVTGSGTQIVGPAGINGTAGVNAYTTTTANFTTPAAGASVTVTVAVAAWASVGQVLFIAGTGYYQVAAILSPTQFSLTNLAGYGNTSGGTTINTGATVSAAGLIGPAGSAGSQGPAGRDGAFSTIYTGNSIQGNGGAASPATLVADIAQATGAFKVYQRDSSGNSKWDVALLSAADAVSSPGAGEISHIASQTSGILSLKKLKTGPAGSVALTDQGGSTGDILIDVPVDGTTVTVVGGKLTASGGGGGGAGQGYWDPSNGLFFQDDFTFSTGIDPHYQSSSSSGATFNPSPTYGQNTTLKVIGAIELITGTSASNTGAALIWGGLPGSAVFSVTYGLGALTFKTRAFLETSLPATGGGYALRIGIVQPGGGSNFFFAQPTQGFFFEYSPDQNSGQWRVGVGGASITYTNTSIAVAADTAYKLEIDVNAAWSSITFIINGVTAATISTGIPTTMGVPFWQYAKGSAGTITRATAIDYWMINYPVTR